MRQNKRFGHLLFAGAMATTGLMAQARAGEVTIWAWDPNFNIAIMKEAATRYRVKHPEVTFNIVDMAKADLEQKLQTSLASGMTKNLPDIVLVEDYGAQKYLRSFPGAFAPLAGTVNHSAFAPYKVQAMTVDGKAYGVPFDTGVTGLFYRRDYIQKAGYTDKDMQSLTWDQFIEMGKKVEAATGKKMFALDPQDIAMVRIMMQSAGRWYFDKNGKPDIKQNPALKAALEVEGKFFKNNTFKPTSGWGDWVGAINRGDVATVISGVWITGSVKAEKGQSGKWGVAPIPKLNVPGATQASNLGGSSWYVLASAKEKAAATDFLNEIYAKDVDFYQAILQSRGAVGSLLASRNGAAYKEADPFFAGDKVWQSFSDWLGKVPPVNYGIYTAEADAAVASQLQALAQGAPIDKVLASINDQLSAQTK